MCSLTPLCYTARRPCFTTDAKLVNALSLPTACDPARVSATCTHERLLPNSACCLSAPLTPFPFPSPPYDTQTTDVDPEFRKAPTSAVAEQLHLTEPAQELVQSMEQVFYDESMEVRLAPILLGALVEASHSEPCNCRTTIGGICNAVASRPSLCKPRALIQTNSGTLDNDELQHRY